MTTNTNSKWYTNVVNEWLTENGGFLPELLDGVMTVSSINDMYPQGQYNLVELSDKVVAIASVGFSFSAVVFIKDIAEIEVDVSYSYEKSDNVTTLTNEGFKNKDQTVKVSINGEKKREKFLKKVLKGRRRYWRDDVMDFVKNHILNREKEITDKLVEENISLACFNFVHWEATLKKRSELKQRKSSNYPKVNEYFNRSLVTYDKTHRIKHSMFASIKSSQHMFVKNIMNHVLLKLTFNEDIKGYELSILDVRKCEMHTIPTEKFFSTLISDKKALNNLMMSAFIDAWDELSPNIHPVTHKEITELIEKRHDVKAYCLEVKKEEILDTALATGEDIPLNSLTTAISMIENIVLSRTNSDVNKDNPFIVTKILTEEETFKTYTRVYLELNRRYSWSPAEQSQDYTQLARDITTHALFKFDEYSHHRLLYGVSTGEEYDKHRNKNISALEYIDKYLNGADATTNRKDFNEKVVYGLLNHVKNDGHLDKEQADTIKTEVITLFL